MSQTTTTPATKSVPKRAMNFALGLNCKFEQNGDDAKTVPFTMTARTGEPISHWFWGNVVHDMNGMQLSKPRLPVDYCHCDDDILGYANKFDTAGGDLTVSGALTPFADGDRANEVIFKQKAGVPYEASIDFSGGDVEIEYIPMDATIEVNGHALTGPATVIRKWTLRGLAICPYGADPNTTTEFKKDGGDGATVDVTIRNQEHSKMSAQNKPAEGASATKTTTETKPAAETQQSAAAAVAEQPPVETEPKKDDQEKPATEPSTEAVAPAVATPVEVPAAAAQQSAEPKGVDADVTISKSKFAAFEKAFGPSGRQLCLDSAIDGKSFEDVTAGYVTKLSADHTAALAAKDAEITKLTARLDALKDGRGDKGVSFSADPKEGQPGDAGESETEKKLKKQGYSDNIAKAAAGVRFVKPTPTSKPPKK
jgi:hypothetical protein